MDLTLKGRAGKRGLMFVSYYGRSRAFISNYRTWQLYHNYGKIVEIASSLLSHESLHLTLNKFSLSASAKLDNLFGRSKTSSRKEYINYLIVKKSILDVQDIYPSGSKQSPS